MDLKGMHQKACVSLSKSGLAPFGVAGAVGAVGAVRLTNVSRRLSTLVHTSCLTAVGIDW